MDDSRRTFSFLGINAIAVAGLTPWLLALADEPQAALSAQSDAAAPLKGRMGRDIPNIQLVTHTDRRVRLYDDLVKGKKVLINFMYADCSNTCPRTTANLVKVQKSFGDRMGKDVFFLSITLTPDHDTPERLQAYAKDHGCGPGWEFLTGRIEDINRLRRYLGVYDATPDITQHVGILTYGNEPEGKWGATSTLAKPDVIAWMVKSRIDGWTAQPWPARIVDQGE
jgi:protein SCO1/2